MSTPAKQRAPYGSLARMIRERAAIYGYSRKTYDHAQTMKLAEIISGELGISDRWRVYEVLDATPRTTEKVICPMCGHESIAEKDE